MASFLTRGRSLVRGIRIMIIQCVLPGAIIGYPVVLPKLPYLGSLSNDDSNENGKKVINRLRLRKQRLCMYTVRAKLLSPFLEHFFAFAVRVRVRELQKLINNS